MAAEVAVAVPVDNRPRLSARLWMAAGAEIVVAVAVATLILHAGAMPAANVHSPRSPETHWQPGVVIMVGFTVAMLAWWLATRSRILALLGAAGLIGVGSSEAVRVTAAHSHLVAMAALEALLVAVPLLLIASVRREQPTADVRRTWPWSVWVLIAIVLNSALLIGLHLPLVHQHSAQTGIVPLWLPAVVVLTGVGYWAAVLVTGGRVSSALRRSALIIGQEVAAILGLAALIRPSPHLHHTNPLGLSPVIDQRLGGFLMLIACAAVTLPLTKRIQQQQLRTEHHVQ